MSRANAIGRTVGTVGIVFCCGLLLWAALTLRQIFDDPMDDWWFDPQAWKAQYNTRNRDNPRGRMIYDLQHRVLRPGMTRREVLILLGTPDAGITQTELTYNIGAWSGMRMDDDLFIVELNAENRFVKAYWTQT